MRIPNPIHLHNQAMAHTDLHAQLQSYYTVQQSHFRNWWPLFFFLLDVILVNVWIVLRIHATRLHHRGVHEAIALALMAEGLRDLQSTPTLWPSRKPPAYNLPPMDTSHAIVRNTDGSRKECVVCSKDRVRNARVRKQPRRKALGEVSNNRRPPKHKATHPAQTRFECRACRVALCEKWDCWTEYHRK